MKSSGYTAEYGGSTGGVINVVTKSGTNDLARRRPASTSKATRSTAGRDEPSAGCPRTRPAPSTSTYPEDSYTRRVEPGFAIGGPIKRDRAWLFAAYQPALTTRQRTVTFTFDESTATKASDQTEHFFNINQTTQVQRQPAHARDLRLESVAAGRMAAGPGRRHLTRRATSTPSTSGRTTRASGSADWVATPKLYVGMRAGYFTNNHTTANVIEAAALCLHARQPSTFWTCPPRFSRLGDSRPI